ncbi:MAG: hypothetical protein JST70_10350 [Bacteroidetes bacterium]|nr:hypothetical protein [Bacteroidota bacterium]
MNYKEDNINYWIAAIDNIFPEGVPERKQWRDLKSISKILSAISAIPDLNHTFFPSGGGLDLDGCILSKSERGCLELNFGVSHIVKPNILYFESFGGDYQWNYFRLELDALQPIEEDAKDYFDEELTELSPGEYVEGYHWDDKSYDGEPLPATARLVIRVLKGAFVIFRKTSVYNTTHGKLDAYDGRHNNMSADEFRNHIKEYKAAYEKYNAE